MVDDR